MDTPLPLAVTMGEPAGVGPELAAMAWQRRSGEGLAPFYLIADPAFVDGRLAASGLAVPVEIVGHPRQVAEAFDRALPILPLSSRVTGGRAGHPSTFDAAAVLESIERGVADIRDRAARAIVTAPIQKESLYGAGFGFPGHTEFLGALTADWSGARRPVMMLAAPGLRVVPVTIHVPLAEVPNLLSEGLIVETGQIVAEDLRSRFGIAVPRLAVAGLNPHAGEGGTIGSEDREIVVPAVARLRAEGIEASGPYPADTMFHAAARKTYDAVLAMYHDQGLIPIKTIAFDSAVNVTLGLPLIRTSPDHGTALDIAGTGKADPSSFVAAIRMADEMSRRG